MSFSEEAQRQELTDRVADLERRVKDLEHFISVLQARKPLGRPPKVA
jgi:hypothetical protein